MPRWRAIDQAQCRRGDALKYLSETLLFLASNDSGRSYSGQRRDGARGQDPKREIANQVNQVRDAGAKMSVPTGSTEERP